MFIYFKIFLSKRAYIRRQFIKKVLMSIVKAFYKKLWKRSLQVKIKAAVEAALTIVRN